MKISHSLQTAHKSFSPPCKGGIVINTRKNVSDNHLHWVFKTMQIRDILGQWKSSEKRLNTFLRKIYIYEVHDAIVFSADFFTWLYIQGFRQVLRLRKLQCENCTPEVFEKHQLLEHNSVLKPFDPVLSTEWSSDFSHTVLGSACPIFFLFGNFLQDVEK